MISVNPRPYRLPVEERGITLADFLVPIRVGERMGSRLRHVALIVVGALFVALTAQITIVQDDQTIPLISDYTIRLATTPVPITGQTFGVLLVGGALGMRRGFLAVALYLALGLFLPFYATGASGLDTYVMRNLDGTLVFGPSAGYLIGFLLAADRVPRGPAGARRAALGDGRGLGPDPVRDRRRDQARPRRRRIPRGVVAGRAASRRGLSPRVGAADGTIHPVDRRERIGTLHRPSQSPCGSGGPKGRLTRLSEPSRGWLGAGASANARPFTGRIRGTGSRPFEDSAISIQRS